MVIECIRVLLQLLNFDVKCPKYDEARAKVYESDWVKQIEQRNKVSQISTVLMHMYVIFWGSFLLVLHVLQRSQT